MPRSDRANTRQHLWRWHFWAGLIVSPIILIASVTGALLVFEDAIKHRIDRDWHFHTSDPKSAPAPLNIMANAAREAVETEERLADVYVFADPQRSVIFTFRDGPFDRRENTRVAIDPISASVVAVRRDESAIETALRVTTDLHTSLLAGIPGRIAVELATGWAVVLVLTGVYLWWPRSWAKIAGVWGVRLKGHRYQQWRDWHSVPGAYTGLALALILFSGLMLSYLNGQAWTAATFLTGGFPPSLIQPPQIDLSTHTNDHNDLDAAYQAAIEHRPDAPLFDLSLPYAETDPIRVFAGSVARPIGTQIVYAHPSSGQVLETIDSDDLPAHGIPISWAYGIHVGAIGGLTTQIIALVCCIVLIAMTLTGIAMWLIRKPAGRVGAPRHAKKPPYRLVYITIILLGLLMPSFGISVLLLIAYQLCLRPLSRLHTAAAG